MSFLGDLVDSISSGKPATIQQKPLQRPITSIVAASSRATAKPPHVPQPGSSPVPNVLKRKAETHDARETAQPLNSNVSAVPPPKISSRPSTPNVTSATPVASKATTFLPRPSTNTPVKAPPKGSYADIMARAKQAQEQRSNSKIGQIKHQATSKEKVSKVAERRREEQERLKNQKPVLSKPLDPRERLAKKRSVSPAKKNDQPKIPKAPRPPMNAPANYKGTMGSSTKRPRNSGAGRVSKHSRYDEYLGTDEEDNSDMDDDNDDDGYGYGSDASSDMEAGWDELEGEEANALKAARQDDAHELAVETKLKAEKEERRRKLAAMAKRVR